MGCHALVVIYLNATDSGCVAAVNSVATKTIARLGGPSLDVSGPFQTHSNLESIRDLDTRNMCFETRERSFTCTGELGFPKGRLSGCAETTLPSHDSCCQSEAAASGCALCTECALNCG